MFTLLQRYTVDKKRGKQRIWCYNGEQWRSWDVQICRIFLLHIIGKNNNGHQDDKTRKELIKVFQTHGLKLEFEFSLKTVDYLDITFDLNTGSYRPYRKPNNDTRYINAKSKHPSFILKQISTAISKQISTNSLNKQIFQKVAPYYNNIL